MVESINCSIRHSQATQERTCLVGVGYTHGHTEAPRARSGSGEQRTAGAALPHAPCLAGGAAGRDTYRTQFECRESTAG
eukprot:scaffold9414_cov156-Isochrysis_galbana.AAC.1